MNQTDLSMKWAIDHTTKKPISARKVFDNPDIKQMSYICIGCVQLSTHMIDEDEKGKGVTFLEHVANDDNPFFRKGKKQKHFKHCRYRNPDGYIVSLAQRNNLPIDEKDKLIRILTSAKLIRSVGYEWGYSRKPYTKFFTHPAHKKFYFFLSSLIQDLDIDSLKKNAGGFDVETESGDKVKLVDLFGYQDDIIRHINKTPTSCIVAVIGTVDKITEDGGHRIIHFITDMVSEKSRNTKAFRLFVPKDYVSKVGNVTLLEKQRLACYGFAEKKLIKGSPVYQMELYSIVHQIVFFDKTPSIQEIDSIDEEYDPLEHTQEECEGFAVRIWGATKMSNQEVDKVLLIYNQFALDNLQEKMSKEELKNEEYHLFNETWSKLAVQVDSLNKKCQQANVLLQQIEQNYKNESQKWFSKIGFNRKMNELKKEMVESNLEVIEVERLYEIKMLLFNQQKSTNDNWTEWENKVLELKGKLASTKQHLDEENKLKQFLNNYRSSILTIPINHPKWTMFLGFQFDELNEKEISIKVTIQFYIYKDQVWSPGSHSSLEKVIEHQIAADGLCIEPKEVLQKLYNKIGNLIIERLKLIGWPEVNCLCPNCKGRMRVQIKGTLKFICWDRECDGSHELKW